MMQLVNCKECMGDRHESCLNPETCLCADNKHGESLLNGVRVDNTKPVDIDEFKNEISEVNYDIDTEPDSYNGEQFDLVAEVIQSNYRFLTIRENKEIWCYSVRDGLYKPHGHTIIEEQTQRLIFKCKNKAVSEVVGMIRRNKTMIDLGDLMDSRLINTQNGILDPNTFTLKPHSPDYLTTTKLPFSIDFEANNTKLWKHILTIIDPKDINILMELIWICITNNNPFKKMFIFKGESNTQKTTLADIIAWIIGNENISRQSPQSFLQKDSRFGTSKFIGKRINMSTEIGNLTAEELENQKALVGGELQNTERKGDNTERYFDPTRFVFLYTTNKLGSIYSSINDNAVITRFQFLIFRNKLDESKTNGQWYDTFFIDEKDKQDSINTIIRFVIAYKKSGVKTKWSNIAHTKQILKEEQPKEDKYFEDGRIIPKEGESISLLEIQEDFQKFTGYPVNMQQIGYILKKNGMVTSQSNSRTVLKGYCFPQVADQTKGLETYD